MSQLKLYVLIAMFCSLVLIGQSEVAPTKPTTLQISLKNSPIDGSDDSSKDEKLVITDSHTANNAPNPLEIKASVSEKPSISTITISTTNISTNTTSTKPSISTPIPPPPTTPAPNPTPKPGPPETGTWSYSYKNNTNMSCIVVQFAAQLNLTYTKKGINGSADELAHLRFNVPVNASVVDGDCGVSEQWFKMSWLADTANNSSMINLTLVFNSNHTMHNYSLHSLNVSLAPVLFVNSTFNSSVELYHGKEWETPLATSYRCNTPTKITLSADTTVAGDMTVSHLQEEAFRNTTAKGFSAARDCSSGDVPDAVPIAVGCALGGLVLVVLIAYLVGRRRSASRGYLSM